MLSTNFSITIRSSTSSAAAIHSCRPTYPAKATYQIVLLFAGNRCVIQLCYDDMRLRGKSQHQAGCPAQGPGEQRQSEFGSDSPSPC
jgi:hypothetical protein